MSDSIKKYNELVEDGVIDPNESFEQRREAKMLSLMARAAKANKAAEVHTRVEEIQKEFGSTSLLLALEIATEELLNDDE